MTRRRVLAAAVALVAVVPACGDDGGGGSFCDAVKELESVGGLGTDVGVGSDPARVLEVYRANRQALARMADTAPEDLAPDATRLADAYTQIVAALERNAGDVARADAEVAVVLDDPATDAAFERVIAYAGEECL